jgi:hypothetical protein
MKILNLFKPFASGLSKKLFVLALVTVLLPLAIMASHFRYGSISWTNTSGNTVNFKISQAWRGDAFGAFPSVGATLNTGETFFYGDGGSTIVSIVVTSVNPGENWFYGERILTHTYASAGNFLAYEASCCRIGALVNNGNGNFRNQTSVNVGSGNSSPVSSIVPIVDVPVNNAAYNFTIPAVDPNSSTLAFRFATSAEAGPGFTQPAGLAVNGATGQMTFNTVGKVIGQLYTTQVMISDGAIEVPLDFIIRISSVVGTPPYFVYPPTPANGTVFTVNAGQTSTFNLQAADNDAGNTVTLSVAGAPVGSTFTPPLPASGNPVSSVFSWATTVADIGTYVLNFNAQDNTLQSASSSVTINVVQSCNLSLSAAITNVSCNGGSNGAIDLSISNANGATTILWSNGATTEDISGLTAGTYSVSVSDANGCSASASYNVTEPAVLNSSASVSSNVSCFGGNDGSAVVSASGGTAPYQYTVGATTNASGIFTGLTAGAYNFTVTDPNGCSSAGTFTITEPTAVSCAITVSPNEPVPGQGVHTIFLGYGPQSVSLTGTGSGGTGGFSYSWGSAGSGSTITVSPTTTTNYILTVTDANGCSSTCNVTINVVDVRCGKNMDKVLVCHRDNGTPQWKTICIGYNDVANHLAHGDYLGNCTTAPSAASTGGTTSALKVEGVESASLKAFGIKASPNPATTQFTLQVNASNSNEKVSLRISDVNGRQIEVMNNLRGGQTFKLGASYKPGIYIAEMVQGKQKVTLKLVKQ